MTWDCTGPNGCHPCDEIWDSVEIKRLCGNNYDIVTYKDKITCPHCHKVTVHTTVFNELHDTDFTLVDDLKPSSPTRFGT